MRSRYQNKVPRCRLNLLPCGQERRTEFLEELKRRNVYRVGVAYVVIAWLVLQVDDVILGNLDAPDWLFEAILIVLALGFPFALLLAWVFELTGGHQTGARH